MTDVLAEKASLFISFFLSFSALTEQDTQKSCKKSLERMPKSEEVNDIHFMDYTLCFQNSVPGFLTTRASYHLTLKTRYLIGISVCTFCL